MIRPSQRVRRDSASTDGADHDDPPGVTALGDERTGIKTLAWNDAEHWLVGAINTGVLGGAVAVNATCELTVRIDSHTGSSAPF